MHVTRPQASLGMDSNNRSVQRDSVPVTHRRVEQVKQFIGIRRYDVQDRTRIGTAIQSGQHLGNLLMCTHKFFVDTSSVASNSGPFNGFKEGWPQGDCQRFTREPYSFSTFRRILLDLTILPVRRTPHTDVGGCWPVTRDFRLGMEVSGFI
jgi:hypothetical protein